MILIKNCDLLLKKGFRPSGDLHNIKEEEHHEVAEHAAPQQGDSVDRSRLKKISRKSKRILSNSPKAFPKY